MVLIIKNTTLGWTDAREKRSLTCQPRRYHRWYLLCTTSSLWVL